MYKERLGSQINDNIVSIKVAFSNVTDTLIVMMDSNGKITGIDFLQRLMTCLLSLCFRPLGLDLYARTA